MTEQEELLLNVLSAMYLHEVVLHFDSKVEQDDEPLFSIRKNGNTYLINDAYYLSEVKPYLRPRSSMTYLEEREYQLICDYSDITDTYYDNVDSIHWLNAQHFDYLTDKEGKTMIDRGLALEAPKGMYN